MVSRGVGHAASASSVASRYTRARHRAAHGAGGTGAGEPHRAAGTGGALLTGGSLLPGLAALARGALGAPDALLTLRAALTDVALRPLEGAGLCPCPDSLLR
ncbi:hypothetical protein ACTXK0_05200 [Corynebacterium variabile]|uniref:hypothetical protein n=1 Tax=Corynebacterium variabile TaxID=1727 RepID=UPI003FD6636D